MLCECQITNKKTDDELDLWFNTFDFSYLRNPSRYS